MKCAISGCNKPAKNRVQTIGGHISNYCEEHTPVAGPYTKKIRKDAPQVHT